MDEPDPFPTPDPGPVRCAHCGQPIVREHRNWSAFYGLWKHEASTFRGCLPEMTTTAEP